MNATTWDMHDTFEQLDKETKGIIELLDHCNGGNFNIHIWALFGDFICPRREIRFYQIGKELISCLSCANMRAFNENPDRIYIELTFINP